MDKEKFLFIIYFIKVNAVYIFFQLKEFFLRSFLICLFSLLRLFTFESDLSDSIETEALLKTYKSTYLSRKFLKRLDNKKIKSIAIIGLYTGMDTILLQRHFNCPVYAFECDPRRFEVLRWRFSDYEKIHFYPLACSDVTGTIDFYQAAFPGASSIFEFDVEAMSEYNQQTREELLTFETGICYQRKVKAQSTRLDDWMRKENINKIDLLGMDVQGATFQVLKGLGDRLKDIRYIICEAEFKPIYKGEVLLCDIYQFLLDQGFECLTPLADESGLFCDLLFKNTNFQDN